MGTESKEEYKQQILSESKNVVLHRLKEIIQMKKSVLEKVERNPKVYDNPNWSFQQAHNNGALQTLSIVEDLLEFVQ